jgi:pimeloyl-ACP methyl ester carboxylesterase
MTTTELSSERAAFLAVQQQLLDEADLDIRPRRIQLEGGSTLQILEAGEGDPLVILHGAGSSSVLMIPLMEKLKGRRLIAVDRPGYGLSDPVDPGGDYRRAAVDVLTGLLDALDLEQVDLAGSSGGGVWSLWLALDRPERIRRLALVGGCPMLPGTRAPWPLRLYSTPWLGELMNRMTPSPSSVKREMAAMGEGETILNYPGQIDAFVAAGSDPVANKTVLDEFRVYLRGPWGARPERLFTEDDLGRVSHPTLLIWGDRDPLGGPGAARRAAASFPNAHLEVLPAGHGPWLGEPQRTGQLVTNFLNEDQV